MVLGDASGKKYKAKWEAYGILISKE